MIVSLIAKEETLRRSQESDIKDQQAKIAKVAKQLDNAANTVQANAFEHEIAFAKSKISSFEDAELESMERSEALDGQKRLADEAVEAAAKILERESARSTETVAKDKILLAAVELQRVAVRAEVSETALSLYDRIAKGKGTAVSEALNQKCTACQMMVRPQRWNDLRDRSNPGGASEPDQMMTCESCGRLLYYDPARDAPQRKTVPVESIAAQIVRSL